MFEVVPGDHNENYEVAARFSDRDLLESGWLVGEAALAKKAAVASAARGESRVILYGIRP